MMTLSLLSALTYIISSPDRSENPTRFAWIAAKSGTSFWGESKIVCSKKKSPRRTILWLITIVLIGFWFWQQDLA